MSVLAFSFSIPNLLCDFFHARNEVTNLWFSFRCRVDFCPGESVQKQVAFASCFVCSLKAKQAHSIAPLNADFRGRTCLAPGNTKMLHKGLTPAKLSTREGQASKSVGKRGLASAESSLHFVNVVWPGMHVACAQTHSCLCCFRPTSLWGLLVDSTVTWIPARRTRWGVRPSCRAAIAVARQWLDWIPPHVITCLYPFATASANRNSSFRTFNAKRDFCHGNKECWAAHLTHPSSWNRTQSENAKQCREWTHKNFLCNRTQKRSAILSSVSKSAAVLTLLPVRVLPLMSSRFMKTWKSFGTPGKSHSCIGVGKLASWKQKELQLKHMQTVVEHKIT